MTSPSISVVEQVSASLSMRSLEHRVIAANLANRDTQGYQRMKLQFERLVADPTETVVPIEQDMVALSENSLQYQGLTRVLGRYFAILGAITNPNRG